MRHWWLAVLGAVFALTGAGVEPASAQYPSPFGSTPGTLNPPFSPYLNLFRRDANVAVNYFGLVRPQIESRNAFQSLGQEVGGLRRQVSSLQQDVDKQRQTGPEGLPGTGHSVRFLSYGGYFLNMGAGGSGGGRAPGGTGGGGGAGSGIPSSSAAFQTSSSAGGYTSIGTSSSSLQYRPPTASRGGYRR